MNPPVLDRRKSARTVTLGAPGKYRSRIEYLEWLTERAIPIGPWSFGLDGILGLFPGFGDLATGLIAAYIVACAFLDGVPRASVVRMMVNVAVDIVLGSLPFVGDAFDVVYKANTKNLAIYREAMEGRRETRRDWWFVALFASAIVVLLAIPVVLVIALAVQFAPYFKLF